MCFISFKVYLSILITNMTNVNKTKSFNSLGNSQSAGSGGGYTQHRLAARLRPQELDWYISFPVTVYLTKQCKV